MQLGSPGPGTPGSDQVPGRVSAGQALSPEVKTTCLVERAGTVSFLDCRTGLRECPLLACPSAEGESGPQARSDVSRVGLAVSVTVSATLFAVTVCYLEIVETNHKHILCFLVKRNK